MALARRTLEIGTAAGLALLAAAVIASSLQLQSGWGPTGPQAGYVPLRLGGLLLLVSLALLVQAARAPGGGETFATREQLARSLSLFVPTVAMAIGMTWLGVYVTGAVFLAYMAQRHGGMHWSRAAALGLGATVLFFLVFELWFGVPLAKGPLEHWLGL
jgi:putative tricarboxylic transport membrane protein